MPADGVWGRSKLCSDVSCNSVCGAPHTRTPAFTDCVRRYAVPVS